MKKIKLFLEAVVVITIVMALIMPGSAVVTNKVVNDTKLFEGTTQADIVEYTKLVRTQGMFAGENIPVSGADDDIFPSVCEDPYGNTVVTFTIQPSFLEGSMGISWSDDPTDPGSWDGWKIDLEDPFCMFFDTAKTEGPEPEYYKGLVGVYIALDEELAGFYTIEDINADPEDPDDWIFGTWDGGAPEPEYACISDMVSYIDKNYPAEIVGPFNFYIYHEIYEEYDIPSCPICFHTGIETNKGVEYFDAQSGELTAPASDPDLVDLGDRFHTVIQYNDPEGDPKIVWKKIVPDEEPDYEFTPYQDTIAEGTNPSIAAYETSRGGQVAIAYVDNYEVKCIYSSDDGETWDTSTIGTGTYPDIYTLGGNLYCAYINDENLFLSSSDDGGETWGTPEQINDEDGSVYEEENSVDLHHAGVVWVDDRGADLDIYWSPVEMGNAPSAPDIDGPNGGTAGQSYPYTFTATDDDGDDIKYLIDWGDDKTDTTELVPSGTDKTVSHIWTEQNTYTITCRAQDENGLIGPATTKTVNMPRSRTIQRPFIQFLQNHPNLFPILRYILGL